MRRVGSWWRLLFLPFAVTVGATAGCGWGHAKAGPAFVDPPIHCNSDLVSGASHTLVTQQLLLPGVMTTRASRDTFTEDYDGDARNENQLNGLIAVADLGGFAVRPVLKQANQAGQDLLLLELRTPNLMQADCASLTIRHAQPPGPGGAPPRFDGSDTFQVADAMSFTFYGHIDAGVFQSLRPRDQPTPGGDDARLTFALPLLPGETFTAPLRGVGIQLTLRIDERGSVIDAPLGDIHGVLSAQELSDVLVPMVAQVVTRAINTTTDADERKSLIGAFEDRKHSPSSDKCMVSADCCALSPTTCKILPAEVLQSFIGGVLTPDVQVFDSAGAWRPVPAGKEKNGYSFGLGFTAVLASIQ
jgi:hypothetical protein